MAHKTKKYKTKTQRSMCWTPLCVNKHNARKQDMHTPTSKSAATIDHAPLPSIRSRLEVILDELSYIY